MCIRYFLITFSNYRASTKLMLSKGVLSHEIHWIKGTEIKTLTHNKL